MAGLTDYAENKLLDHVLGKTSYTMPTTYVGLFTATPSDAGGGTEVTTAGGTLYARQALQPTSASSGGAAANSADIDFPVAGANWGTVTHFGVFDASSGGNLLAWGPLSSSDTINLGNQYAFPTGDLDFTID